MILRKYSPRCRRYEDYEIPDTWNVALTAPTMDTFVDCAGCGRSIPFGASFTSLEIHTKSGIGYAVCKNCHAAEKKRKIQRESVQARRDYELVKSIAQFDKTVGAIRAAHGLPPLIPNEFKAHSGLLEED